MVSKYAMMYLLYFFNLSTVFFSQKLFISFRAKPSEQLNTKITISQNPKDAV